jgi:hypothetical protein
MDAMKNLAAGAVCIGSLFALNAYTQVADPAAPSPPLRYESVFSDYRPLHAAPLLPWTELFTTDGDFSDRVDQTAPLEINVTKPPEGHRGHEHRGSGRKVTLDAQPHPPANK